MRTNKPVCDQSPTADLRPGTRTSDAPPRPPDGTGDAPPIGGASSGAPSRPDGTEIARPTPDNHNEASIETLFEVLAERWAEETRYMSNSALMRTVPSYGAILALGDQAVPLLLRCLLAGDPGHWHLILRGITDTGPEIPHTDWGNVRAIEVAWLRWGYAQGLIAVNSTPA